MSTTTKKGLIEDIEQWLEKLAPRNPAYQHHQTGENNGDAHLKSMLVHHQVIVPVTAGNSTWGRGREFSTRSSTDDGTSEC